MADLRVEHLTYAYPGNGKPVLSNIQFTIHQGEIVLFTGASGCGKTTLALALAGMIPKRIMGHLRGSIYYGDLCITKERPYRIARHISIVFQNTQHSLFHYDVETELAFGPENLGLKKEQIASRVQEALIAMGIESLRKRSVSSLSPGEKQKVALASALAMRCDVLILDEPSCDLDAVSFETMMKSIRKMQQERQMTVLVFEHKLDQVIEFVDRVLLMDKGHIVLDESVRNAFHNETLFTARGVLVPDMVKLSRRLPAVFGQSIALSVQEAFDALNDSSWHRKIQKLHTQTIQDYRQEVDSGYPVCCKNQSIDTFRHLHAAFSEHSFDLVAGDRLAIIGSNGVGKSKLASMLAGLDDQACESKGNAWISQSKIGYLPQDIDSLFLQNTVRDELMWSLKQSQTREGSEQEAIDHMLSLIDLAQQVRISPHSLSFGQRKRLALGLVMMPNPDVLIFDEPLTGLDFGHVASFFRFLHDLHRSRASTMLMISHDMKAVATYAKTVAVLHEGHVLVQGDPNFVFSKSRELQLARLIPPPIARLYNMLTGDTHVKTVVTFEALLSLFV